MTTFLVTNGSVPRALESLDTLPTQLYVTVAAPTEELFDRICVPQSSNAWSSLMETLRLLPSLDTRTVVRHTLVKGWNLGWEDEYAALDRIAEPMFIEPKGYVFVGDSRRRMTMDNMPSHIEVREFSQRLAEKLSMDILTDRPCTLTDRSDPVVAAADWATRQISHTEPTYAGVPGATDGTFLWALKNIPIVTMGAGDRQVPHQVDEWVDLDQLVETAKIYAVAALNYLWPTDAE